MTSTHRTQRQPELNQPSPGPQARPPTLRTGPGEAFSDANLASILKLRYCTECGRAQYPPQAQCRYCLCDELEWRSCPGDGILLSAIDLHHSLWEFFRRHPSARPWPVASVRLQAGVTVFAHLHLGSFHVESATSVPLDSAVTVFSHADCSERAVLIAAAAGTAVDHFRERSALAADLGLLEPAIEPEGI